MYLLVEVLQLIREISGVFLSKNGLKNFEKFTEKHLCQSLFLNNVAGWKSVTVRSSHWRSSVKKGVLKSFADFTGKNLC